MQELKNILHYDRYHKGYHISDGIPDGSDKEPPISNEDLKEGMT